MGLSARFIVVATLAGFGVGCGSNASTDALDLGVEETIGQELVRRRGCATCHQSAESADGILSGQTVPAAGSTSAYGRNLTPDATGLGPWADIAIIRAIRYGIDREQQPLCPTMPHFDGSDAAQPAMTDVEAAAIVAYLRSLPAVARSIPPSSCPPIKPRPPLDLSVPPIPPTDLATVPND